MTAPEGFELDVDAEGLAELFVEVDERLAREAAAAEADTA